MIKAYFPTSTLNFSSVISMQRILPAFYYHNETLWWNRYEKTAGEDDANIVMYNRFPEWEIIDDERDNYPLIIVFKELEMGKSYWKTRRVKIGKKKVAIYSTSNAVEVPIKDILAGKISFVFRNEEEKNRLLQKVEFGTDECKVLTMLRSIKPDAFTVAKGNEDTIRLVDGKAIISISDDEGNNVKEASAKEKDFIKSERLRGAELGFELGIYVRSLREGVFFAAFREKIEFDYWRKNILPKVFNSILSDFISQPAIEWNPNRSAVLEVISSIMIEYMKEELADKAVKDGWMSLYEHWESAEKEFKIAPITDVYLQAFAAFLECGAISSKYPRYLCSKYLRCPEFMLALYGATVGYTRFSRTLLSNECYLPKTENESSRTTSAVNVIKKPKKKKSPRKNGQAVNNEVRQNVTQDTFLTP